MALPLEGIRVFDWTNAAVGPIASELLGSLGADVIKVESPEGEIMSTMKPFQKGWPTGYTSHNFDKRCIAVDLKQEADREKAHRLLQTCDVFIENFRPGVARRLGFGYSDVARYAPNIVYVEATAWGTRGPMGTWPGADPNLQAYSGWSSIIGQPGKGGEFYRGYGHLDATSASYICASVLMALVNRQKTGKGAYIEIEMLSASINLQLTRMAEFFATGLAPIAHGSGDSMTVPNQAYKCGNQKYIAITAETPAQWRGFCAAIEKPALAEDPRFATNNDRVKNREALNEILEPIFMAKPTTWWTVIMRRNGVPNSNFYDYEMLQDSTHIKANDMLVTVDVPHQGPMMTSGYPFYFNGVRPHVLPAPAPGQHTAEVVDSLPALKTPLPEGAVGEFPEGPNDLLQAYEGLTVVEATQGISGAYTALLFREGGARVVKVEPPAGDFLREIGPKIGETSSLFFQLNRGKRSVTLDLETEEGRAGLRKLLETADIFIEDMGPDRAKALGLDFETLKAKNPKLVQATLTPWGEAGPLANMPGSELTVQAMSDYPNAIGTAGEPPIRIGADIAYMNTAIFLYQAIASALYQRGVTGQGQRVGASMLGSLLYTRKTVWAAMWNPDEWMGTHVQNYTTPSVYGYKAKGGQVYLNMRRADEENYYGMLAELGLLEKVIADPRFGNGGRDAVGMGPAAEQVKPIWEEAFQNFTPLELVDLFRRWDAEGTVVNTLDSVMSSEQVQALDMRGEVDVPGFGKAEVLSLPWWLNGVRQRLEVAPPALGEGNAELLGQAQASRV